ncbi:MAG TPA: VOC family protein [Acidimicrobiales bacterium]|nr:VOC family protein [Acidimicrobiales bacterium]
MTERVVVSALAVDCRDPDTLATFWYELMGGEMVVWPQYGVVALRCPGITLDFTLVPEDKVVKNRLHLDLATSDPQTTIDRAIALGAKRLHDFDKHTVMADPEGNEFCVLHAMPADRPWQPPT